MDTMEPKDCSVYNAAAIISKRWAMIILLETFKAEGAGFQELKRRVPGITSKVLSQRLAGLCDAHLISKSVRTDTAPARTHYVLTKNGRDFIKVVSELKRWAQSHGLGGRGCGSISCRKCTL
jgi:DNA-binding HxlR family transcriptional regulator